MRRAFGPLEPQVSSLYRAMFIDLGDCARQLAEVAPARSILEVGCGEGQFAEALLRRFPESSYVGIDPLVDAGRLFRGDGSRVAFERLDLATFFASTSERFDLVVLADVLHHVPRSERTALLATARSLTAPGGAYAVKDWVRSRHPVQALVSFSDRVLTGDRVTYFAPGELEALTALDPSDALLRRSTVRPWRNNLLIVRRRAPAVPAR